MLKIYKPLIKDLWFKKELLSDEKTMAYNHAYGGCIAFSEEKWPDWYERWFSDNEHYYRYLLDEKGNFVGEIAYHLDNQLWKCDVLIHDKYRKQGYGKEGLQLLCREAKSRSISCLYDDIAIDNKAVELFIRMGFIEVLRNEEYIRVKKEL